ncbi:hypothetical protein PCIT_a3038 [Pseudoalteromonas citrea]|uniref:Uncharacterized protein n=2 Tax=Pseudoalteromonas citrea TaxID=43655 RepID=A0AAD4AI05_9GAMM|nr:hypothetical protein [Pseudoalteromonas citrea]KAF7770083.1 hypothetical protein PCIT_a3038 [Pseudoalteromonas citrea]
MWADLFNGGLEKLGEIGSTITNAYVEIEKEKAKQPEVVKAQEPIKGRQVDGSTVVARPVVQPPLNQNTMIIAGIGVAVLLVILLRK